MLGLRYNLFIRSILHSLEKCARIRYRCVIRCLITAETCTWLKFSSRSHPVPFSQHHTGRCRSLDRRRLCIYPASSWQLQQLPSQRFRSAVVPLNGKHQQQDRWQTSQIGLSSWPGLMKCICCEVLHCRAARHHIATHCMQCGRTFTQTDLLLQAARTWRLID